MLRILALFLAICALGAIEAPVGTSPQVVPISNDSVDIGTAIVWNDDSSINLILRGAEGVALRKVHGEVTLSPDPAAPPVLVGIDQEFAEPVAEASVLLYRSTTRLIEGSSVRIQLKVHVLTKDAKGRSRQLQAGIGEPVGKGENSARVLTYAIQPYYPQPLLSPGLATFIPTSVANKNVSYWSTRFTVMPQPSDVALGTYPGWCLQKNVTMNSGKTYRGTLHWMGAGDLPAHLQNANYDKVNWLLNNRPAGISADNFQNAIWALIGQPYSSNATVTQLVNAAQANGAGFRPRSGEVGGIIIEPEQPTVQRTVTVHVLPPPPPPPGPKTTG